MPAKPGLSSHGRLLTIFLDPSRGSGGVLNIVNDMGRPAMITNPDNRVAVVDYP